jgi:hypothetical protein
MNIRKIIREEVEDFEWVENIKPSLLNKVIIFEPLIDIEEFDKVKELIKLYDKNVDFEVFTVGFIYIHHLLIDLGGVVAYGGINHRGPDSQTMKELHENMDWYISERKSEYFQNPERINGREFFNL